MHAKKKTNMRQQVDINLFNYMIVYIFEEQQEFMIDDKYSSMQSPLHSAEWQTCTDCVVLL